MAAKRPAAQSNPGWGKSRTDTEGRQALEEQALSDLRAGIAYCESVRDFVSRDLLRKILDSAEEHVDFLERQFDLIKQIGIERYVMLDAGAANHGE